MRAKRTNAWSIDCMLCLLCVFLCEEARAESDKSAPSQTDPQCIQREVTFDGVEPLKYATVAGESGFRLSLYHNYLGDCSVATDQHCGSAGYIIPGDDVAIAKTCGAWSYVQFIGKARITVGWAATDRLTDRPVSPEPKSEIYPPLDFSQYYHFKLTKGQGLPVCEAYLQRLNQTLFHRQPWCGVPETDQVPGFELLHRQHLTRAEFVSLAPILSGFIYGYDRGRSYPHVPSSWRYEPPVDVDNDGVSDNVIIWDEDDLVRPTCGSPFGPNMLLAHTAQSGLVLTPDNRAVDVVRTGELFGQAGLSKADAAHAQKSNATSAYQPIGMFASVFRYRDSTYVETFFDDSYHKISADKAQAVVLLADTLGVFLRRNGATRQVCEYDLLDSGDSQ